MSTRYAKYSDIVTVAATWSVTAGTAESAYPVSNLDDLRPWLVARSTGTTITYRATFGGAQALQAVAFINTNATAIQLTNGAGLSQAVSIPSTPDDGLTLDPWIDLTNVANASSTTWNIALTGPSGVALGVPVLVATLRTMPLLWSGLEEDERHGTIVHETEYGVRLKLGFGIRQRVWRGEFIRESFRADLLALLRDARGPLRSFLLVPDHTQNDALLVDLTDDSTTFARRHPRITGAAATFTEQQKGWL